MYAPRRHRRHLAFAGLALGMLLLHGLLVPPLWPPAGAPAATRVAALQVRNIRVAPPPVLPEPEPEPEPQPVPAPSPPPAPAPPVQADAPPAATPSEPDTPAAAPETGDPAPEPAPKRTTYPTQLPPAQRLVYRLQRGAQTGEAVLRWEPADDRYLAVFDAQIGGESLFAWSSRGAIDATGIAPERFVQRSKRSGAQATNFRRDAGRISFSGGGMEYLLVPAAQDRLTWLLQLPAIVEAAPERFGPGSRVALFVAGTRGEAGVWVFDVLASETLDLAAGPLPTLHLERRPPGPYGTRAEVWLDPQRHHLPVQVHLSNMGSPALELTLVD